MARHIAAVVVTFNRLKLLRRLVAQLQRFDALTEILVIDNASGDGTGEWLAGLHDPRVRVRTLDHNRGGAGGFQAGLDWAYEIGADLAWLMDDDGIPDDDCLDRLLAYDGDYDFWGPAVLAEQRPAELCFPVRLPGTVTVARTLADLTRVSHDGSVPDVVIPFNGVLVTRELVERIGSVRAEFFIWGDDVEYLWRAKDAGARIATITDAHFLHPATDDLGTPMLGGRTTYNHSPSDLKHYCMARNNTVNLMTHHGLAHAAAFWAKTAWFYTFVKPDWRRLSLSVQAITDGLRRDFSGHERFLTAPRGGDPDGTVAAVVVTYQRPELLDRLLDSLAAQTRQVDVVYVVDNGGDEATAQVLASHDELNLVIDHTGENLGGAGGFNRGMKAAYLGGAEWLWLMDDDVRAAPWALEALLRADGELLACVREDRHGRLVEKAATRFDLTHPWRIRPKVSQVDEVYARRQDMPEKVHIENGAFEGCFVNRRVVSAIGYADPSFFIFYDDCDFQLRAQRAGYEFFAVRDALMRRAFDFVQTDALASWKGYYMYRNLFAVHLRYGRNPLVRLKPILIAAGVVACSPLRGGIHEAKNAVRGLVDSYAMRHLDERARI